MVALVDGRTMPRDGLHDELRCATVSRCMLAGLWKWDELRELAKELTAVSDSSSILCSTDFHETANLLWW
eukprot:3755897-Rhodomonas_salina.2